MIETDTVLGVGSRGVALVKVGVTEEVAVAVAGLVGVGSGVRSSGLGVQVGTSPGVELTCATPASPEAGKAQLCKTSAARNKNAIKV